MNENADIENAWLLAQQATGPLSINQLAHLKRMRDEPREREGVDVLQALWRAADTAIYYKDEASAWQARWLRLDKDAESVKAALRVLRDAIADE